MGTQRGTCMEKKFLFVCGMGRSGTTELTRILSTHSQIALGMERYKRLWRPERIHQLTPELFQKNRFFDFSRPLTNITPDLHEQWQTYYAALEAKYDTAVYVGDKLTQLRVREMRAAFPDAKFIFIIRNVFDVAHSWERRAKKLTDRWPEAHDARHAVLEWNKGLRELSGYLTDFGDAVTYVEYAAFFGDTGRQHLNRLLEFLELRPDRPILRRFNRGSRAYLNWISSKDRSLDPETTKFIAENADMSLWHSLCSDERVAGSGATAQVHSRDRATVNAGAE
jgi:hypothetical protein